MLPESLSRRARTIVRIDKAQEKKQTNIFGSVGGTAVPHAMHAGEGGITEYPVEHSQKFGSLLVRYCTGNECWLLVFIVPCV